LIWKYPDHEKIRKVPVFRDPERYFAESTRLSPKHPRPRPTKEKIIVQPVGKRGWSCKSYYFLESKGSLHAPPVKRKK